MPDEVVQADTYLYATFGGDDELIALIEVPPAAIGGVSVYFDQAPQELSDTSKPIIIIRHKPLLSDAESRGNSGVRLITTIGYEIVANALTRSYEDVTPAAARIDELLDLAHDSDGKIFKIERIGPPIRRPYTDVGGREFREAGANWEVQVSQFV
jgi:hypothetical protein